MTPRICLIDIETSPILGYAWGMYDVNILKVVEPVRIICGAWKWLGKDEITVKALCDYPDYIPGNPDDSSLVADLWDILDSADVVVAHNGDSFDIKVCNARFVANGLLAPSDYKSVDTLKVAKKYFRFGSNGLNDLGGYLSEGQKAHTGGFQTWLDCMAGVPEAWTKMKEYNERDIELLERVYLRLRPFMNNHPNLNLIAPKKVRTNTHVCATCQSTETQKRGFTITKRGRYQRYSCRSCGSWSSGPYERVKTA